MTTAPSIILVHPQLGENIGAAARVMANFGLSDLVLVAPRDVWPNPKAVSMAVGSPVLDKARLVDDLTAGIGDLTRIYATTARPRGMEKPVMTAREAMSEIRAASESGEKVGILFGGEKGGLLNDAVALSDAIITLPVDRNFSSLNLGQAVGIVCHEWRAEEGAPAVFNPVSDIATRFDLEGMMAHFEDELERAGFFYPPDKTPLMIQNMRAAFVRGRWTTQEVRTFRGAVKALALGRGKARTLRDE
jgi:tRNA/rRNA methyltransferase